MLISKPDSLLILEKRLITLRVSHEQRSLTTKALIIPVVYIKNYAEGYLPIPAYGKEKLIE